MTATYRFYKTKENEWYIDIPQWPKDNIAALQMVAGADMMLDVLSNDGNEIKLELSTKDSSNTYVLTYLGDATEHFGEGAFYQYSTRKDPELIANMWLCDVTKYVFGGMFPKTIYFDIIE